VVSIFVNPLQFGPNEDYLRYPRPLANDLEVCASKGAEVVFVPEVEDMYPLPALTQVELPKLAEHLCGKFRPGHFRGVATVVLKLFNIIQPDRAYFGEKDYQQLCIIRRMVQDLNLEVDIVPIATHREADGLAMSSRNVYLSPEERGSATILFQALKMSRDAIEQGEKQVSAIKRQAMEMLASAPQVRAEYFEIVDPIEVQPVSLVDGPVRIAGAIWLGKTRLIDNIAARLRQ
jgi:pantoate--beta-alanine ligase